ncbi:hypothetical protein [Occallatibacter riparius]|uniref:Uncharacterized protein n=1 Tax=Occallatibacter riparius TaxID=1002689 RepID=A0A9J7BIK1_9BACT|nr:hypothetical protein [Occallatibacter riparius]UWZ82764.1 hypothetical protein MOP44_19595 [Occallatibacter riparius]
MVRHSLLPIRDKYPTRGKRRPPVRVLVAAAILALLCGTWVALYVQQRTLQSRAETLLAAVQRVKLGTTSSADAQAVIATWYQFGPVGTTCGPDGCSSVIRLRHTLPGPLTRHGERPANNQLAGLADHLGLRGSAVSAGLKYKNGVVTGKAFSVEVMLPFRDWLVRGEFVPNLAVLSNETAAFTEDELQHVLPTRPYCVVRRMKGPGSLSISFMPQEPADRQAQYMDFRLSCISQFTPCNQESQILPAASELVNETF